MKRKLCLYGFAVLLLGGCAGKSSENRVVRKVNVAEVVSAGEADTVSFVATTVAAEEVNVAFRIGGPILKMMVKEGDYVAKGALIATMDGRDYQLQLAATQAEYDQIKADADRVTAMFNEGTTTAQNYDRARYGLQQITQKLNNHRNQLADTRLTAPVAGYVKEKFHEAGETVGAGMPIVALSSGDRVEVEVNVSARDYARISRFVAFSCAIDAVGDKRLSLELVRTSAMANATQLYTLRFAIKDSYDRRVVTPGMSAVIYAALEGEGSAEVCVPSSAVTNKEGTTAVFVYSPKSKTVAKREVKVKTMNADGSATVEGLSVGETVVSAGASHLADGQRVDVVKPSSESNVGDLL
ncbi:MAG: efflux RND transporter periplasmic adaptor subunit [Bacteroidaceae bacterium]